MSYKSCKKEEYTCELYELLEIRVLVSYENCKKTDCNYELYELLENRVHLQ